MARRRSEKRAAGLPPLNVLSQVNVSGEATKTGASPGEVFALSEKTSSLKGLRLRGLMAIPEPAGDAGLQRKRFREVREIFFSHRKSTHLNSSHQIISYAAFCLKIKNDKNIMEDSTDSHL